MIPVFIGYDTTETIAWHVLAHSIIKRSSLPCSFTPVGNTTLPPTLWSRRRGTKDSTEFSNARFAIPALMQYEGWAIFMDCDMVCHGDIVELWDQRDLKYAVMCRQHVQEVRPGETKFLGQEQARYQRKNWSSLMLMNCSHPAWRALDFNACPGLEMHSFKFLDDDAIGEITGTWNELVQPTDSMTSDRHWFPSLAHFTYGGPWHGWVRNPQAWAWCGEFSDMLRGRNPRAHVDAHLASDGVIVGGSYHVSSADAEAEHKLVR